MSDLTRLELEQIRRQCETGFRIELGTPSAEDIFRLLTTLDQLQQRLDKNVCNSGHVTLPLILWDCPECHNQTRREREALRIQVQELTDRLLQVTNTLPSAVAHKEEEVT